MNQTRPTGETMPLTHDDIRQAVRDGMDDVKDLIADRTARFDEKLDDLRDRLDALNGKTITHGQELVRLDTKVQNLSKEVFGRRRDDAVPIPVPPPAAAPAPKPVPPTDWKKVAAGLAIGGGAIYTGLRVLFMFGDWLQKMGLR